MLSKMKNRKLTKKTLSVLDRAFENAQKQCDNEKPLPISGLSIDWTGKPTEEERIQEVFEALIRSGLTPEEAKDRTPGEYLEFKALNDAFEN